MKLGMTKVKASSILSYNPGILKAENAEVSVMLTVFMVVMEA
jgi:hypothetical protein